MYWTTTLFVIAISAGFISEVQGRSSRWARDLTDTPFCSWPGLRVAQIKDTAYLDGGLIRGIKILPNGDPGTPETVESMQGLVYKLNFSIPFDSNTNFAQIFTNVSKPGGGSSLSNLAPNYDDGAMLANDHEFILYGGLLKNTDGDEAPDGNQVLGYRVSDYGVPKPALGLGFFAAKRLPSNTTRYVTYGGAANAPSENKAWYFGGHQSPTGGPIYQRGSGDPSYDPASVSNTLITLDLSDSLTQNWTNSSLVPSHVEGRANPSVVWVPVSEQGVLVVLGGVAYPEYDNSDRISQNEAESKKVSPGYMINIDVYDVASKKWYKQPTSGELPPQLARGCAVVATAADSSSHNIYYYGGYSGINEAEEFSNAVWVLSLPSFIWTKLYDGDSKQGRIGHQCLTPYPDQMVVIGGQLSARGGGSLPCLGSLVRIFNLTDGKWLDSYDPNVWSAYGVPKDVQAKIGGDSTGGATLKAPDVWATPALSEVFGTPYNTSKISTYYPYPSQDLGGGESGDQKSSSKGGTPSWIAPVLGVVLGLIFITALAVAILLFRRRYLLKKPSPSDIPRNGYPSFITKWLSTTNSGDKVPTEDLSTRYGETESRNETPNNFMSEVVGSPPMGTARYGPQYEMPPSDRRYELSSTPMPVELSGEALSVVDILTKHTRLHSPSSPHSQNSPRSALPPPSIFAASTSQGQQPSSLGSSSQGGAPTVSSSVSREQHQQQRGDSPLPPNRGAVVSDLSRISEHHASHLRNLSNETTSSITANMNMAPSPSPPTTPPPMQADFSSIGGPVSPPLPSPPTAIDGQNGVIPDYLMARGNSPSPLGFYETGAYAGASGLSRTHGATGSLRLSAFRENSDDLNANAPPRAHHTQ